MGIIQDMKKKNEIHIENHIKNIVSGSCGLFVLGHKLESTLIRSQDIYAPQMFGLSEVSAIITLH